MKAKRIYRLVHDQARKLAAQDCMTAEAGWIVQVAEPSRTLDQNAAQWPILEEFARQAQWPVNGRLSHISAEDWKDILTAAFSQEQVRVAPSLDGAGMVLLGHRTSQFGKKRFGEWLEFLHATAIERGVDLRRPGE